MGERLVAVPDTDGELYAILSTLEEVLLALVDEENPTEPLASAVAVGALQRVLGVVITAERGPVAQPIGADGRLELVPVRFVHLDEEDLRMVAGALSTLGLAATGAGDETIAEVLTEFAGATGRTATDLVADAARAHGLLDLAPDADTVALAELLQGDRVLLTSADQAAYDRLTDRVLGLFHVGDPLARFLYRGLP